jgi:hypothetical protein
MSNRTPLIIALAAAAMWPAAASAASPATPAQRGSSSPLTEARLDGSQLTVSLRCRRAATVTVAGTERRVACRGGRARARFRVRLNAPLKIAARANGHSMTATLPVGAKPGTARVAAWQTWRGGYGMCQHVDNGGNRNSLRIGIARGDAFGLPLGTQYNWRTWIYWVDARTGAYGFTPYAYSSPGYAGLNGVYSGFQQWTINPGYWIAPAIQVMTSSGYSEWNFVGVEGNFPAPAYDASWCRY